MSLQAHGLGGRLPLVDPAAMTATQRALYDKMMASVVPWADAAGFQSRDERGRVIGPFNCTLLSPEIGGSFLSLQKTEQDHTSLTPRAREVVILSVGSVWQAPYELYAHAAVGAKAGLSAEQIEALAAGRPAETLDERERAAQQFTLQLAARHAVDDQTYAAANAAWGDRGLFEMVVLIGCYLSVCAMLNAFAVPLPAKVAGIVPGAAAAADSEKRS